MKRELEALENDVKAELRSSATSIADPITDGVVDVDLYLASSPKMLWILKEPVDDVVNGVPSGGGWSMAKDILAVGKFGNKPPFAPIAYVAYSVFNGFKKWGDIDYVTKNPAVKAAVKHIAHININKMPALPTSGGTDFGRIYSQNRNLLLRQIYTLSPDILIFGSTIGFFLEDLGLKREEFKPIGSLKYCVKGQRLFIDAFHPSQWTQVSPIDYVDEIVATIKEQSPVLPRPLSEISIS